jgi:hypothetical protein
MVDGWWMGVPMLAGWSLVRARRGTPTLPGYHRVGRGMVPPWLWAAAIAAGLACLATIGMWGMSAVSRAVWAHGTEGAVAAVAAGVGWWVARGARVQGGAPPISIVVGLALLLVLCVVTVAAIR